MVEETTGGTDATFLATTLDEEGRPTAASFSHAGTVNAIFGHFLYKSLVRSGRVHEKSRQRLHHTYWLLASMWVILFALGLWLILSPLVRNGGDITSYNTTDAFLTALGGIDFMSFMFIKPVTRIKRLSQDMTQLSILLADHQVGVALRVIEMDGRREMKETIGRCADHVRNLTAHTLALIEEYFQVGEAPSKDAAAIDGEVTAIRDHIDDVLRDGKIDPAVRGVLEDTVVRVEDVNRTVKRIARPGRLRSIVRVGL